MFRNKCFIIEVMPVNFIELRSQIKKMGGQAGEQTDRRKRLFDEATGLLQAYATHGERLNERVDKAVQANPRLRCARPTGEVLTQGFEPPEEVFMPAILAADGSQINPSRHDPFPFCVINVGVFHTCPGQAPREFQRTTLLTYEEVLTPQGLLNEGTVALRRDLYERQMLAELADGMEKPVVTLTDGPLELFSEARESEEYRTALKQYIESLQTLEQMNVITAGYVDKPFSDLVVRLLELTLLAEDDFSKAGVRRPLLGVRDETLFSGLLQPGQRSAVFAIQSQQAQNFQDGLGLHFFYLNIGRLEHPAMARVEIPAWVAQDPALLALLHTTLITQSRQMGAHPYPYALHRAHEIALVSFDERKRILDMIAIEHLNRGLSVGESSHKQANKDLPSTRTRYP